MITCRRPIELFLLVLTLVAAALAVAPGGALAAELKVEAMVIESASGPHSFQTEIADSDPTRARGLMFRRHMAGDHAMLFVWDAPIEAAMWMKNTLIPLDMLFVAGDGRVVLYCGQHQAGIARRDQCRAAGQGGDRARRRRGGAARHQAGRPGAASPVQGLMQPGLAERGQKRIFTSSVRAFRIAGRSAVW